MRKHHRTDLYIMKAYHIYDEHRAPRMSHLVANAEGGYIIYGERDDGKYREDGTWPTCAVSSAGGPTASEAPGQLLTYTIDTGMGYRCNGYSFKVLGWAEVRDGVIIRQAGTIPELNDKINAFVMK